MPGVRVLSVPGACHPVLVYSVARPGQGWSAGHWAQSLTGLWPVNTEWLSPTSDLYRETVASELLVHDRDYDMWQMTVMT